jgi:hypothetical protein
VGESVSSVQQIVTLMTRAGLPHIRMSAEHVMIGARPEEIHGTAAAWLASLSVTERARVAARLHEHDKADLRPRMDRLFAVLSEVSDDDGFDDIRPRLLARTAAASRQDDGCFTMLAKMLTQDYLLKAQKAALNARQDPPGVDRVVVEAVLAADFTLRRWRFEAEAEQPKVRDVLAILRAVLAWKILKDGEGPTEDVFAVAMTRHAGEEPGP